MYEATRHMSLHCFTCLFTIWPSNANYCRKAAADGSFVAQSRGVAGVAAASAGACAYAAAGMRQDHHIASMQSCLSSCVTDAQGGMRCMHI